MADWLAIGGGLAGLISLAVVLFTLGMRLGRIEERVKDVPLIRQDLIAVQIKVAEIGVRVAEIDANLKFLWSLYSQEQRHRLGSGGGGSMYKPGEEWIIQVDEDWIIGPRGEALLPEELKEKARRWCAEFTSMEPGDVMPALMQRAGVSYLSRLADEKGSSLGTLLTLLYAFCKKVKREEVPVKRG